jgi:hypothetical protein
VRQAISDWFYRRNISDEELEYLRQRIQLGDPSALTEASEKVMAGDLSAASVLPRVKFNPGSRLLVEAHGFEYSSLHISKELKRTLFNAFGLNPYSVIGERFPQIYIEKSKRIRTKLAKEKGWRDFEPIKSVADNEYLYMDLMDLSKKGGLVMTILVDSKLVDLIIADLSSWISGGEVWWHNNLNPKARDFIKSVYADDSQEYPVVNIEPLDPQLWQAYKAISHIPMSPIYRRNISDEDIEYLRQKANLGDEEAREKLWELRIPFCPTCDDEGIVLNKTPAPIEENIFTGELAPCPHINIQVDYSSDLEPTVCLDCGRTSHVGCPDCNPGWRLYGNLSGRP